MRGIRSSIYVLTMLLILLAACAPQATPVATATDTPTPAPAQPAVASDTPTAAAAPSEPAAATPTLVPAPLVPSMEVGSEYRYFDGALLEAVPGGPFTMGKKGGTDNPEHVVTLGDYWIYRTKVTNQQYAHCVAVGQCTPPDLNDNLTYTDPLRVNDPVSGVNWDQGQAYCAFAHGRLPTEAEQEKAGRGPDANIYPWGNGAPGCDKLNFNNCLGKTTDVNRYPQGKSYYSTYDMAGNAFEWVADWYDGFYYRDASAGQDPEGPDKGQKRSVRASSYKSNTDQVPLYTRFYDFPTSHRRDLGFRCVVLDPGFYAPACDFVSYIGSDVSGGPIPDVVPTPDCPDVSASTNGYCNNNVPGGEPAANLKFSPNPLPPLVPGQPSIPAGCSGGPNLYYCNGGGPATIQSVCSVPAPPVPAGCPGPDWTESPPGTCHYVGGGTGATECPPGDIYDPVNHCCTSTPGTASDFNLCPVAAPYYVGGICVPWPSSGNGPLVAVNVILGNCDHGGNNGCPTSDPNYPNCTPGCNKNANSCPYGFDAGNCCCYYTDPGCYPG